MATCGPSDEQEPPTLQFCVVLFLPAPLSFEFGKSKQSRCLLTCLTAPVSFFHCRKYPYLASKIIAKLSVCPTKRSCYPESAVPVSVTTRFCNLVSFLSQPAYLMQVDYSVYAPQCWVKNVYLAINARLCLWDCYFSFFTNICHVAVLVGYFWYNTARFFASSAVVRFILCSRQVASDGVDRTQFSFTIGRNST